MRLDMMRQFLAVLNEDELAEMARVITLALERMKARTA
jgi:hypothetical protein